MQLPSVLLRDTDRYFVPSNTGLDRDLAAFFQIRQHFLGVAVGLHIFENVLNLAVRPDHET